MKYWQLMIDKKDKDILELFEKNGRLSIQALSSKLSIPPSTIHNRIKRMENLNIIEGYSVKLNEKVMERDFTVFMLVNGSTGKDGTGNTFSLEAGTYFLQWRAPGFDSGDQRAKIAYTTSTNYNTLFNSQSSSGVSYLSGESAQSQTNYESNIFASGSATVTITETTYFRLQHYVKSNDAIRCKFNPSKQ